MTATLSVHIDAPIAAVFAQFRDPRTWQQVRPDVRFSDVHVAPDGIGTFYRWRTTVAGVPIEGFDVFTEFVPNERIVDRSSLSIEGTWTFTFASEGAGTRVRLQNRAGRLWRLPLIERLVDAVAVAGHRPVLAMVKAKLEDRDERPAAS